MRTITSNLERMKLPTKHSGTTGDSTRGSDETARRPPSVKAALSVSFGQRAPHRASTRDSSPVRRALPRSYDRENSDDSRRSPSRHRSHSRELSDSDREWSRSRGRDMDRHFDEDRERGRDRERDSERGRDRDRRYDYDRHSRETSRRYRERSHESSRHYRESGSHRSRSPSRRRSQSMHERNMEGERHSPRQDTGKNKTSASSNLAKLKDIYGDLTNQKDDAGKEGVPSGTEEVIRLGGSTWR